MRSADIRPFPLANGLRDQVTSKPQFKLNLMSCKLSTSIPSGMLLFTKGLFTMKKILWILLGTLVIIAVGIQFYPYRHDHTNPPVTAEPNWNSPETRSLAKRACFDCHSNETVWPWYSNIAPVSWLIEQDVIEGRRVVNFSTWDRPQGEAGEAWEVVQSGWMPPSSYLKLHPEARLSADEKSTLADGLRQSLARIQ
jgi:hypothetical protein